MFLIILDQFEATNFFISLNPTHSNFVSVMPWLTLLTTYFQISFLYAISENFESLNHVIVAVNSTEL
jgi:hypothetical protein